MSIRTFLALNLSIAVTRRIAEEAERRRSLVPPDWRVVWVPPAQLHLTLRFLGAIEEPLVEGIVGRLGALDHAPAELSARGLGAFPSHGKPAVLWVGVEGGDALMKLQRDVEAAMVGLGLAGEERPFHPHVTVARVKERGSGDLGWTSNAEFGSSVVSEIVVYESRTSSKGSEYLARARVPIAKKES